jgi:multidrug transporter EmrE-like cation transporter
MGYFFVALTVVLTVVGQFLIKWRVNEAGALPPDLHGKMLFVFDLLLNPWVILGLGSAFAASLCWMLAMTKLPLSHAYPFTAVSFVLVVLGGAWLFSEPLSLMKVVGVGLIVAGVALMGME